MSKIWQESAPSNIALIKYMGKKPGNIPVNPSLSYCVEHFRSYVRLECIDTASDTWVSPEGQNIELTDFGKTRFLNHLKLIKQHLNYSGVFQVSSYNDFPSDCGLASSASSFAALTKTAFHAITDLTGRSFTLSEMASVSRQGSGSSCRSFFSPWSVWHNETAEPIDLGIDDLVHAVAVIDSSKKKVTTSNAHQRIHTSLLDSHRPQRASMRLQQLIKSLKSKDWEQSFEICWAEFWDMHVLFETSNPSFGYMKSDSLLVLNRIRNFWRENGDGPLVTMDAGPNIHLFFRSDQKKLARQILDENHDMKWIAPHVD